MSEICPVDQLQFSSFTYGYQFNKLYGIERDLKEVDDEHRHEVDNKIAYQS